MSWLAPSSVRAGTCNAAGTPNFIDADFNFDKLRDFATANFDFIQSYRPNTNVVQRPTRGVGRGYSLTGHHELLVPLFAAALLEGAEG